MAVEIASIALLVLLALAALCAVPVCVSIASFLRHRSAALAAERGLSGPAPDVESLPRVLLQIPTHNEPRVIARAMRAAAALDWPRDRLEIQVLDDSTDETGAIAEATAEELRRGGVQVQVLRRSNRDGFKAGALQAGLGRSNAPYVAIFDADYVPPRDWLLRVYAAIRADDRIAFVQTRIAHLNRNANILTRAQALMLDLYHAFEQPARAWSGLPNRFNGTCGLWRRKAIDEAGGWSGATLAEDLDISYRAHSRGWRAAYLVTIAAPGELPSSWRAWRSQQYRWTKGTAEATLKTLRGLLPMLSPWRRAMLAGVTFSETMLPFIAVLAIAAGIICVAATGRLYDPVLTPAAAATIAFHAAVRITGVVLSRGVASGERHSGLLADLGAALAFEISMLPERIRATTSALAGRKSAFVRTEKHGA